MIHPPPQLPVRRDPSQLEARRVETPTHLLFRWYGWALCVILGSYLFLDRGIAHLHIPGTFLYIGETTIVIGLAGLVVGTNWLRPAIARDRLVHLLVIW